MFGTPSFSNLTPVIKNLIIINVLFFLATISFQNLGIDLTNYFGLHQFQSPKFMPHQLVTHMFMHGSFTHSPVVGALTSDTMRFAEGAE